MLNGGNRFETMSYVNIYSFFGSLYTCILKKIPICRYTFIYNGARFKASFRLCPYMKIKLILLFQSWDMEDVLHTR